jgi:hypothetical protein
VQPRSRVTCLPFSSVQHLSRSTLITATPAGPCDDDVSDDDRGPAPGAHSGSPRCRVEVRATSPLIGLSVPNHLHRPLPFLLPLLADDDRYEMRRECQEILPGLILGPLQAAKSLDVLQGLGITHVYVPPSIPPAHDRSD